MEIKKNLSLEEFKLSSRPEDDIKFLSKISTEGSLIECHAKVFKSTGNWFPELIGPFVQLDALVAAKQ